MIRHQESRRVSLLVGPMLAVLSGGALLAMTGPACRADVQPAASPEWFRDVPARAPGDAAGAPAAADPNADATPAAPVAPAAPADAAAPAAPAAPPAPAVPPLPPAPALPPQYTPAPPGGFFSGNRRSPYGGYPFGEMNSYVIAETRLATARAICRRAETELSVAFSNAQHEFESSQAFQDALREENADYDNLTAARRKALKSLGTDEKYQRLAALRADLSEQIIMRRAAHDISQQEILVLAKLKMGFAIDMREMEAVSLGNDGGDVKTAQDKLVAAGSKVAAMRAKYDQSLRTNPEIIAARRNLEDAQIVKTTAAAYLDGTVLSAQQALDYAYFLNRQQTYNGSDVWWGGGGGMRY